MCEVYESAPDDIQSLMRQAEENFRLTKYYPHKHKIFELYSLAEELAGSRNKYHELLKWFDGNCKNCEPCKVVAALSRSKQQAA